MILCEICNSKFKCINGEYICEEGHISETKLEIADEIHFSLRSQVQKVKKPTTPLTKYSFKYKNLLLFNLFFKEFVLFLKCSSSKFIDFYTNFFSGDRNVISSPIKISFGYLIILGYLTKRTELEKKGQLYFYRTFLLEIERFDYISKIFNIKNILGIKKTSNKSLGINKKCISWLNKHRLMDKLGTSNYPCNKKHRKILSETSLSHPLIEYNKAIIRQEIDHSQEILLKYFYKVIEILAIQKSEDLEKYFIKFLRLRNLSDKLFSPEDEICIFLYLFNEKNKLEINFKSAIKNINDFMNNKYYDENKGNKTTLLDLIVLLTHTSHLQFHNRISQVLKIKEFKVTNNIFVTEKIGKQYFRSIKWRSYRIYLRRIKLLLSNKMNIKIKKQYIEDDRI